MRPAIAPLARKLGAPILLYRIEGGYGVHPRWSDTVRRGKMRGYVSRVITPEEYSQMTDDELFAEIERELFVDEACLDGEYRGKCLAEYLERSMYVCPDHGISRFESHGDIIECKECGKRIRYTKTKELVGEGFDFSYRFVSDWYDYQSDYINSIDPRDFGGSPHYIDKVDLYEVIPYKRKQLIKEGAEISFFGDGLCLDGERCDFDSISAIAVLGRNKLNIYHGEKVYQMKGDKHFCALKYVQIYHRYNNVKKGDNNVQFLGL